MTGFLIGLFGAAIIFGVAGFFFSRMNYKKRFAMDYSIKNTFPYELNYQGKFTDNILGNVCIVLALACLIGFYSIINVNRQNTMLLFTAIAGIVLTILMGVSFFLPLKLLRTHMVMAIFLFLASFLTPAGAAVGVLPYYQDFRNPGMLVLIIIEGIIALFYFGLTMNPKLSLNIKMDVQKDEKGNDVYKRPRWIVLAFSEWLAIIGAYLTPILLIVLDIIL